MSPVKQSCVHEIDVTFTKVDELDLLVKRLKKDNHVTVTTSLKKFEKTPYQYDYWYSKSKVVMKIANKDCKIFDLTDKLLKTYDKVSDK